jgi:predicted GNAT family acetyltransferase
MGNHEWLQNGRPFSMQAQPMTDDTRPAIHDNVVAHRFEMIVDRHAAVATYAIDGDTITFIHTVVPEALRGRGIARQLVEFALGSARERGLKVIPQCEMFDAYMRKHAETHDLLADPGRFAAPARPD